MEMLKGNNWLPWKRRMLAVLRDLDLEQYIEVGSIPKAPLDPANPTKDETEAKEKWQKGDAKTRTRIELSISDPEMIHISGAKTASEMWKQLTQVKESKGKLGILAIRRSLYRTTAEEGVSIIEHVAKLRKLQEELHLMGSIVGDEDFAMILLSSLPESWDVYTSAYLGAQSNTPTITSHELISVLIEEDRRRKDRNGDPQNVSMQGNKLRNKSGKNSWKKKDIICHHCNKKGHMKQDCYAPGGPKEGQGPKQQQRRQGNTPNHANQVTESLGDMSFMSTTQSYPSSAPNGPFSKFDWIFDSGTTSHIATKREMFKEYSPLSDSSVGGIAKEPAKAIGRGTVILPFEINGRTITHTLTEVLHVPEAPNCLLSSSRFDDKG